MGNFSSSRITITDDSTNSGAPENTLIDAWIIDPFTDNGKKWIIGRTSNLLNSTAYFAYKKFCGYRKASFINAIRLDMDDGTCTLSGWYSFYGYYG